MFPVGIDVSKNTTDLCMLYDGIKGRIKTRNIQNNRHSVENILRWLRLQHCGPEDVHVVMEATGVYHERLATELHDAGFYVSLANPHRSREFARGMGIMTKRIRWMRICWPATHSLRTLTAGSRRHPKSDISVHSCDGGMFCWVMPCVRRTGWRNTCPQTHLQILSVPACIWRSCCATR